MKTNTLKKEIHQAVDNITDVEVPAAVFTILKKSMLENEVPVTVSPSLPQTKKGIQGSSL
jgi:hypothetical protein